jgi:hypothetical protein
MEQIISFSIDGGLVSLQYANCHDCELLKEFQLEVDAFETIEISTPEGSYEAEDAYIDVAKHLWAQFGATLTDDDGAEGNIDEDFLHFKKGEPVYDIWHWFESEFNVSVAKDLMGF